MVGNNTRQKHALLPFSRLTHWRRLRGPWSRGEIALVMSVGAAQEWHSIEHVFLEPLEPEINDRGNEESDHLGKDEAADDDKAKRPAR